MKLLLTSGGVTNPSIRAALVDLLGKPIEDATALCIPTASYGHASARTPVQLFDFISGRDSPPMTRLGWRSVGLLELTALPSVAEEHWLGWVRAADALLVNGGDAPFLCHWLRQSGLAAVLPSLASVWVGLSAGSMVLTPRIGEDFLNGTPITGSDRTLGLVDFSIFPHLEHPQLTENTLAAAERWAADIAGPAYALDDASALTVVDGAVEVVSEGLWRRYPA